MNLVWLLMTKPKKEKTYFRYRIFTTIGSSLSFLSEHPTIDKLWEAIISSKDNDNKLKFLSIGNGSNISNILDFRIRPSIIYMVDNIYGDGPVVVSENSDGELTESETTRSTRRFNRTVIGQQVGTSQRQPNGPNKSRKG